MGVTVIYSFSATTKIKQDDDDFVYITVGGTTAARLAGNGGTYTLDLAGQITEGASLAPGTSVGTISYSAVTEHMTFTGSTTAAEFAFNSSGNFLVPGILAENDALSTLLGSPAPSTDELWTNGQEWYYSPVNTMHLLGNLTAVALHGGFREFRTGLAPAEAFLDVVEGVDTYGLVRVLYTPVYSEALKEIRYELTSDGLRATIYGGTRKVPFEKAVLKMLRDIENNEAMQQASNRAL